MNYQEPTLKRILDIALSMLMLGMSLPVVLPISMAIKLEDGGPFSVKSGGAGTGSVLVFTNLEPWCLMPKKNMALLKLGKRRSHYESRPITENHGIGRIAEVLNILVGDMSFVGPRSLAVGEILTDKKGNRVNYEEIRGFWDRLKARPGLTGLATVYIPKNSSPRRKFKYDLLYINKHSLCLDIHLIALSFWISFRGRWESRDEKF